MLTYVIGTNFHNKNKDVFELDETFLCFADAAEYVAAKTGIDLDDIELNKVYHKKLSVGTKSFVIWQAE